MKIINKFTGDTLAKVTDRQDISLKEAINEVGEFIQCKVPWNPDVVILQSFSCYSEDLQVVDDNWNEKPVLPWNAFSHEEDSKIISNVKKAVEDYRSANGHGPYSSNRGVLMLDRASGKVWTDEFIDTRSYIIYDDEDIIELGSVIHLHGFAITEKSVTYYAAKYMKKGNQK